MQRGEARKASAGTYGPCPPVRRDPVLDDLFQSVLQALCHVFREACFAWLPLLRSQKQPLDDTFHLGSASIWFPVDKPSPSWQVVPFATTGALCRGAAPHCATHAGRPLLLSRLVPPVPSCSESRRASRTWQVELSDQSSEDLGSNPGFPKWKIIGLI